LRSPRGRRAIGRVGARRFDAAGVSNAAPTSTVATGSVGALQGDVGRRPRITGGGDDGVLEAAATLKWRRRASQRVKQGYMGVLGRAVCVASSPRVKQKGLCVCKSAIEGI
jgi:hypothetical protein